MKQLVFVLHYGIFLTLLSLSYVNAQTPKFSEKADELYNSGKYVELISFCDTNLPAVLQKNDSLEVAKLLFGKGKGQYHKSKHLISVENLKKAETYLKDVPSNNALRADIFYFIHINYSMKSFILKELKYGKMSLDLYESETVEQKNYERILILYRRVANPNVTLGNYEVAKSYLDKAEELLKHIPLDYKLPQPLINYRFSSGYQKIVVGLIETAFFAENYDIISIKKITESVVREKEKLDALYASNKDSNINFHSYSSALNYYCRYFIVNEDKIDFDLSSLYDEIDKSIKLIDKKSYQRHIHLYLGNKVDVYRHEKDYDKALALINKIIDEAGESHNRYVNFLVQKAQIYFSMGNIEEGRLWVKKGIERIHLGTEPLKSDYSNFEPGLKLEDVYLLLSIANKVIDRSSMPEKAKKAELSLVYTLAFTQFLNTYKDQPLNKRLQNCFKTIVKNLIKYNCLQKEQISQIENIQNRLAWKKFIQSRNVVLLPVIDSLEQIDFKLRKQLVDAKQQLKLKQIDSINNAILQHQRKLELEYPKLANFTQDNFDINRFQNKIPIDEMVLKFMFFKDEFAVFQISKDTIKWKLHLWGSEQNKLLVNHLKQVRTPSKALQFDDSLTKLLLPESSFKYKTLTVIPDNPIYQLPFETLIYNDSYLIESKAIRYSSHLRFAFINNDNFVDKKTKTAVSIFAPEYLGGKNQYTTRSGSYYLEGAQKEAKAIEELFNAISFTGDQATKEQFISRKSESTVLHMAMHATIDQDNPEFSYFNFSNNEKLYLEELYGLKIPNKLAVLSACNTGIGKVDDASGMVSLQRALNFAGTKATVASLWEVPDKTTSNIMISFYEYLKKGKTKSEALKYAKQDYFKTTSGDKLKHPYYWGGFVLYGDDTPILVKSNLNILYGILTIIAIILVGVFWMQNKRKRP